MYYVEFKRIKLFSLIIVLFFTFSFLIINAKAAEELVLLPDDQQEAGNDFSEEDAFDSNNYQNTKQNKILIRKSRLKREPFLQDRVFVQNNENATFNGLAMRISLIVFALVGFLVFIKVFLSRNQFTKPGSLLDELAQKITGNFSANSQGLKLKQTLILTPGQNLYLIEIDGKRLLVGGTQHGGVQFLTDLTGTTAKNEKLDFKQFMENDKNLSKAVSESLLSSNNIKGTSAPAVENPFMSHDSVENKDLSDEIKQNVSSFHNRQTFKRRTNFRKSLFNENVNAAEELLRKA